MIFVPAAPSLSMSSIFVSGGITDFSFCSPSRGPTSTTRTKLSGGLVDVARERLRTAGATDLRGREQEATAVRKLRVSIVSTVANDEVKYLDQEERYAESFEVLERQRTYIVVEHRVLMGVQARNGRPMTSSCGESTLTHLWRSPCLSVNPADATSALRVHRCKERCLADW